MVTPEEGSFLTHANYLRAIASEAGRSLLSTDAKALGALAGRISVLPSMKDTKPSTVDVGQVRKSLANAWGTELLLALSGRYAVDDEVTRLANNWAVVQTYYVVYHATQALAVAKGFPRPDSHPKTQNQFISFWVQRPLDLSPWTLGAKAGGWSNCPSGKTIDKVVHPWSGCSPATQLSLTAKAYRTTRQDKIAQATQDMRQRKKRDRRRAWIAEEGARLQQNRKPRREPSWRTPQLTASEKQTVDSKVPPYGLIQYLYRLRIKTNYVDSAMFTDGPSDEASSATVHSDLRYIASATLLLHELHIEHLVGPSRVRKWVDDWLATNAPSGGKPLGVQLRRPLL